MLRKVKSDTPAPGFQGVAAGTVCFNNAISFGAFIKGKPVANI